MTTERIAYLHEWPQNELNINLPKTHYAIFTTIHFNNHYIFIIFQLVHPVNLSRSKIYSVRMSRRVLRYSLSMDWSQLTVAVVIKVCTIRTWRKTFSLSSGAVHVLDIAPATAPATRCLHHIPDCNSLSVKSSGTNASSPTSIICNQVILYYFHRPLSINFLKKQYTKIHAHKHLLRRVANNEQYPICLKKGVKAGILEIRHNLSSRFHLCPS